MLQIVHSLILFSINNKTRTLIVDIVQLTHRHADRVSKCTTRWTRRSCIHSQSLTCTCFISDGISQWQMPNPVPNRPSKIRFNIVCHLYHRSGDRKFYHFANKPYALLNGWSNKRNVYNDISKVYLFHKEKKFTQIISSYNSINLRVAPKPSKSCQQSLASPVS